MTTLAHNTERSGPHKSVPVIIKNDARFTFAPGEREADWHEASDDEYNAYCAYWNAESERVMGADAAVAVGRFRPDGPAGYRARSLPNAPLRSTRAEAVEDERAYLDRT